MRFESRCTERIRRTADAAHPSQTTREARRFPAVQLDRAAGSLKSRQTALCAVFPP